LPKWLRGPLVQAWGGEAVGAMELAHFAGAALDITCKPGATMAGRDLPTGSVRLDTPGQVSALPGYGDGDWWVQDAAAALPAWVLAAVPGEKVLDMCAAPGGKTMQLAATGATVVALDLSEARMRRVEENLKRTGLAAEIVIGDGLEHQGIYDAILLDAPCSATGTIRRHPDLPHAKDGSDFAGLIELQARMLAHAWGMLKPGGRMVFCTCSLLPDEGEVRVEEALKAFPDMSVDRDALALKGVDPGWITQEGGLRLRPDYWADKGGMDGFYIACLRKAA
jgi:16S rRNA (cytosine967-C5)-methyltransferase